MTYRPAYRQSTRKRLPYESGTRSKSATTVAACINGSHTVGLTPAVAERHVANILKKLRLRTRGQIAVWTVTNVFGVLLR